MLEAAGAWPPISESHVEMDGAWALYEAWVRLQHGDIDIALVFASGRAGVERVACGRRSPCRTTRTTSSRSAPTTCPVGAAGAGGARQDRQVPSATSPRSWPGRGKTAKTNANAAVSGDFTVEDLLAKDYVVGTAARARLRSAGRRRRARSCSSRVIERARSCERPAWIAGIDHRADPHYPGMRDLSVSPSTRIAGEKSGVGRGGVEVAELTAVCSAEELVLADALGLGDRCRRSIHRVVRWPGTPMMVTGLARIGEAFRQVSDERQATGARARVARARACNRTSSASWRHGSHG